MHAIPVAQRMAWASKRETTRVEDVAYSLLGLFGISMPLLYGEGDKAFLRLQEEIMRKCNDLSIFSWEANAAGQSSGYLGMLASSPRLFHACRHMSKTSIDRQITSRTHFAICNRGIQFTTPDLFVLNPNNNQEAADYVLPLFRSTEQVTLQRCLVLKKVGPGLYARVGAPKHLDLSKLHRTWTVEREIYLLAQVSASLGSTLDSSHGSSLEFRTNTTQLRSFSIQGLEPRDSWDTPRSRFLTNGDPSFVAYIKIYPDFASGSDAEFFVITMGFRQCANARDMEAFAYLIHPDIWVLYSAPGRSLGWMVMSSIKHQALRDGTNPSDGTRLDISRYKVTVSVQSRVSRGLPVHRVTATWAIDRKRKQEPEPVTG